LLKDVTSILLLNVQMQLKAKPKKHQPVEVPGKPTNAKQQLGAHYFQFSCPKYKTYKIT